MSDSFFASHAKRVLSRRLLLRGLALGLSAPLAYRLVRSATAAPSGKPKRFLLYYIPHGVPPEHFNPVGQKTDFTLAESGESILGPLEPYKSLINIYNGFKYPGASTHEGILKFLSGAHVENNDETTPRTTIEHFIANELGVSTLALGAVPNRIWGQDKDGKLMWDGQPVVPQKNPLMAYSEVFGSLSAAPDPAPSSESSDEQLHNALMDLTAKDISSLQTELKGMSREQSKLQTHLEAIEALKSSGTGTGTTSCTSAPDLPAVEALRQKAQGQSDEWFLTEENFPAILAAHLEVAAGALICNSRPVVAVQNLYTNCEIDMSFVGQGVSGAHHSVLSHTNPQIGGGTANMDVRAPFAKAQRWFIEQLTTHLIERLSVPDPADSSSTVLDNTIILLCSEIGEGAWHTSWTREILAGAPPGIISHMPIVTIGGGGGALKTGQILDYNDVGTNEENTHDRPASDVWLTLAQAMGVSATSFGGSTGPCTEALA